jgi:hypothetical protein
MLRSLHYGGKSAASGRDDKKKRRHGRRLRSNRRRPRRIRRVVLFNFNPNLSSRPKHRGFMRCAVERSQHLQIAAATNAAISPLRRQKAPPPVEMTNVRRGQKHRLPAETTRRSSDIDEDYAAIGIEPRRIRRIVLSTHPEFVISTAASRLHAMRSGEIAAFTDSRSYKCCDLSTTAAKKRRLRSR